jgi:hypothetical protein
MPAANGSSTLSPPSTASPPGGRRSSAAPQPPVGEIELRFSGLDEKIVMRVNEARRPSAVVWSCLTHTGHPEWEGTKIVFELTKDEQSAVLKFRHIGLSPTLNCYETCESGWEHFLTSLLNYAEHGEGNPF